MMAANRGQMRFLWIKINFSAALFLISSSAPCIAQLEQATEHRGLTNSSTLLKNGDLIFVQSRTEQAPQITRVTGSKLTHCGIIFGDRNGWVVLEGAGRTDIRSLEDWQRGEAGGKTGEPVWLRRLKNRDSLLTPGNLEQLKKEAMKLHRTHYDFAFAWNNTYFENRGRRDQVEKEYVYCSELIYKAFQRALDIKVGTPHAIKDYYANLPELEAANIKKKLEEAKDAKRCRNDEPFDPQELAVSPVEVFASDLLEDVP